MIRDYGGKRIKAPSLDMNNTEQISLKVGALPHSTLKSHINIIMDSSSVYIIISKQCMAEQSRSADLYFE